MPRAARRRRSPSREPTSDAPAASGWPGCTVMSPVARSSRAPTSGVNVTRGGPAAAAGPDLADPESPPQLVRARRPQQQRSREGARLRVRSAGGPPGPADTEPASPAGPGERRRVTGSAGRGVLHVEAELLDLLEPACEEAVDVSLRAQPRDRELNFATFAAMIRTQKTLQFNANGFKLP